jgi:mannan endo-1,6-alpha-mannosidase
MISVLARALAQTRDLTRPVDGSKYSGSSRDDLIKSILQNSAKGAAASCAGGSSKTLCGQDWALGSWDGDSGVGQEISALEVFLANLPSKALLTANTTTSTTPTVNGAQTGTNTTSAKPSSATGGASEMSAQLTLPLLVFGAVSMWMTTL